MVVLVLFRATVELPEWLVEVDRVGRLQVLLLLVQQWNGDPTG